MCFILYVLYFQFSPGNFNFIMVGSNEVLD
jgi:hypothetical protein